MAPRHEQRLSSGQWVGDFDAERFEERAGIA
jgi:hypothetical protein